MGGVMARMCAKQTLAIRSMHHCSLNDPAHFVGPRLTLPVPSPSASGELTIFHLFLCFNNWT